MLGFSLLHNAGSAQSSGSVHAVAGVLAALGASFMWGTMYVPYRKAYLSGMNPLSFVTVFTVGELVTMFLLAITLNGGLRQVTRELAMNRGVLFWLFLGGFCWVVGDLFQQYATKYIGIGRGIPLSNTNQLWGLAWGALVFGELAHANAAHRLLVGAGSVVMILGALAVSTAIASERENVSTKQALERECSRYGLDSARVLAAYSGAEDRTATRGEQDARGWWDYVILAAAAGVFVYLGMNAQAPPLTMNAAWLWALGAVLVVSAAVCGLRLWKVTRFS
jgi:hypothetical protein